MITAYHTMKVLHHTLLLPYCVLYVTMSCPATYATLSVHVTAYLPGLHHRCET